MQKINITQYIKGRKLLGLTLEKIPLSMKLSFIFMVSSVGLANAVGRISGIAAPYAVAVLLSSYGVTGVFILLGAVSIVVAIAIATIGIETKGVSVESLSIDAVANK